jgi:hypothetical protein
MTFNDPSANVIAIPGGGVISYIPHPPPPAPPPTPPPVYQRTIRSIVVPNTNPAPPVSGQTSPQNPNGSSKPDYWTWLSSQTMLKLQLLATAAGDVASMISPILDGTFRSIAGHLVSGLGAIWNHVQDLYQVFQQGNLGGAVNELASFAWDLTTAIIAKATWSQDFFIGLGLAAVGLGDVGSDGEATAVLITVGAFQLTTDLALFFSETYSQWESS